MMPGGRLSNRNYSLLNKQVTKHCLGYHRSTFLVGGTLSILHDFSGQKYGPPIDHGNEQKPLKDRGVTSMNHSAAR